MAKTEILRDRLACLLADIRYGVKTSNPNPADLKDADRILSLVAHPAEALREAFVEGAKWASEFHEAYLFDHGDEINKEAERRYPLS